MSNQTARDVRYSAPVQKAAAAVGIVFLIIGVLGFIPGVTTNFDELAFATYLVFGGVIYFVLFLYGIIVGQESAANFVPVNSADDVLHLVLAVGMVGLGLALGRRSRVV